MSSKGGWFRSEMAFSPEMAGRFCSFHLFLLSTLFFFYSAIVSTDSIFGMFHTLLTYFLYLHQSCSYFRSYSFSVLILEVTSFFTMYFCHLLYIVPVIHKLPAYILWKIHISCVYHNLFFLSFLKS